MHENILYFYSKFQRDFDYLNCKVCKIITLTIFDHKINQNKLNRKSDSMKETFIAQKVGANRMK